jgi:hypothetical protein
MYDKQLDSGRGTLLHLCDDVIQQEVSTKLRVIGTCLIVLFNASKYVLFWFIQIRALESHYYMKPNSNSDKTLERSMLHVLKISRALFIFVRVM